MTEQIAAIIRQYLEDPESMITEATLLKDDLGLDSFDIMNIVIECEEVFGVRISHEVLGNFITVKDIERALIRNSRGGSPA